MSAIRRALLKTKVLNFNSFCALRRLTTKSEDTANILTSEHSDIEIPHITIQELIYSNIEKFYKFTANECAETGRSYTYEQLRVKSRNFSKTLRKNLKLGKGDTVAILLPNVPEFSICILGLLEAGLIATTINPLYTPDEISKQIIDSSAKAIITLGTLHSTAQAASVLAKKQLPIIAIKTKNDESLPSGAINFAELINTKTDIPDFEPGNKDDIAFMPYSSGTTGLPKGVELTHYNIVSNIAQISHPKVTYLIETSDSYQEVLPAVLPFFHIYGLVITLLNTHRIGTKNIILNKFTPDLYISALKNNKATLLYAAPPLILFLTAHPDVKPEYLKHVRLLCSGAAPLGALDEERFLEKHGKHITILQGYGLTETSPAISTLTLNDVKKYNYPGTVGRVLPNTLAKIVGADDPTGKPLGPNQSGELLMKGPQVMKGYHNRPEENKNAYVDGWFRTGDMVHYNEDGFLFVTDRLKELIKVKGFQVAPAELEEVVRDFPSVNDAAVIGVPHPVFGEVPRAYVVPKKNTQLKTDELYEFVSTKVAKYKQLQGGIEVVDAIPKNAAGKILRRQLKLKYEKSMA